MKCTRCDEHDAKYEVVVYRDERSKTMQISKICKSCLDIVMGALLPKGMAVHAGEWFKSPEN